MYAMENMYHMYIYIYTYICILNIHNMYIYILCIDTYYLSIYLYIYMFEKMIDSYILHDLDIELNES